ncbi:MAG: O-antigen ligase family protein [Elusimicrobiota bacterium]
MRARRTLRDAARSLPFIGAGIAALGSVLLFATMLNDSFALPKLLAVAVGAWLAWLGLCLGEEGALARTPLDQAAALFGTAAILAAAFSVDRPLSLLGRHYSYASGLLPWSACAALFYGCVSLRRSPGGWTRLAVWCVGAGGLSSAYALLQRAGLEPFALRDLVPQHFVAGASGSPVNLGACLAVLLPAGLHLSLSESGRTRTAARAASLLMLGALALTLSFSAYLGALAACLTALFLSGRLPLRRPSRQSLQALALVSLALFAALFMIWKVRPGIVSDPARTHTWIAAGKAFLKRPLLGTGPDTLMLSFRRFRSEDTLRTLGDRRGYLSAQNDLIQALSTLGLLGLAAYLWLQWRLWGALRAASEEPALKGPASVAAGAFAGLFVQSKFGPPPLAALAILSVWAAWVVPCHPVRLKADRILRFSVLFFLSFILFVLLRLCAADRDYGLGVRAQLAGRLLEAERRFGRAFELFPAEMQYGASYNLSLLNRSQHAATPPQLSLELASEAVRVGRDSVRWHPRDPASSHMLGLSMLIESRLGGPSPLSEAAAVLDRAQELDPYFLPLVGTRHMIADIQGDTQTVQALAQRHAHIKALLSKSGS